MRSFSSGRDGMPPRIAARPDVSQWGLDDLLTLREAAFLHWPDGPLTERSLRNAARDGLLPVTEIARKLLTSRRAVLEMSRCAPRPTDAAPRHADETEASPSGSRNAEAAYRRLMASLGDPKD